jgi:TorA maturation chaperone TorD
LSSAEGLSPLGDAFVFLASLFRYPDAALWQALAAALPTAAEFTSSVLGRPLRLPAQRVIEQTHVDLFCANPFGLPAPPYFSCYVEESGRIEGDITQMVRRMLADEGLAADPLLKEPDDHLTVVLELAACLCCRCDSPAPATAARARAALRQLTEGLALVLPRFHAAVAAAAAADMGCVDFYVDSATLCLHLTALCREHLVLPSTAF